MNGYRTQQKKLLLSFLSAHGEEVFTLPALAAALAPQGVGKSTVYRLVSRLVAEGAVRRFAREGGGTVYQYLSRGDCGAHLHLRCTDCGRVIHLGVAESDLLTRTLRERISFLLDGQRTLLLGHCDVCAKGAREV